MERERERCAGEWTNEWEVKGASQDDYQKFGAAQLDVFGQATFGWAFWSYQTSLVVGPSSNLCSKVTSELQQMGNHLGEIFLGSFKLAFLVFWYYFQPPTFLRRELEAPHLVSSLSSFVYCDSNCFDVPIEAVAIQTGS